MKRSVQTGRFMLRACARCGTLFPVECEKYNTRKYCNDCSDAMPHAHSLHKRDVENAPLGKEDREMIEKICPECDAAFMPRNGRDLCCSDACRAARKRRLDTEAHRRLRGSKNKSVYKDDAVVVERVQRMTLAEEREEKARRRAAFFAARDAAFERAGLPIPKIVVRNGVRIERRGTCVGGAAFNPTFPIAPKSYYYR